MRATPAVVAALGFDDGLGLGFGARKECTTPKQCARPALPQPAASRIRHLLATGRHAYHFFAAISFITSISRSATTFSPAALRGLWPRSAGLRTRRPGLEFGQLGRESQAVLGFLMSRQRAVAFSNSLQ